MQMPKSNRKWTKIATFSLILQLWGTMLFLYENMTNISGLLEKGSREEMSLKTHATHYDTISALLSLPL